MPFEQLISLTTIVGVSLYAVANEDATKSEGLKLVCLGALVVLAQLILNKILGAESGEFASTGMRDILLVKEIRAKTGGVIVGYMFALSGLLAILKSLLGGQVRVGDQNETEARVAKKSSGAQ